MASENFKKLNLSNAFLFAAALEDPEICRLVLEIIVERPIDHVTVKPERNILFSSDFRSVRLDELPPHTRDFRRELGGFTCTIKVRMV